MSYLGSVAVAQIEPSDYELARNGMAFALGIKNTGAGQAPQTTPPTVTPGFVLYNPPTSNKNVVLRGLGAYPITGTPTAGYVLMAGMLGAASLPTSIPTANTANYFWGSTSDGASSKQGSLIIAGGLTLTAAPQNGYFPLSFYGGANTGFMGSAAINFELRGSILIKPGQAIALGVCENGAGTTPLFAPVAYGNEFNAKTE